MLEIPRKQLDEIKAHSREGVPREVCGMLFGKKGLVTEVVRVPNLMKEFKDDMYAMDPQTVLDIETDAEERGLQFLGIYHSHPRWPAVPSTFDIALAWPPYSYVIVGLRGRRVHEVASWKLNGEKGQAHSMIREEITWQ